MSNEETYTYKQVAKAIEAVKVAEQFTERAYDIFSERADYSVAGEKLLSEKENRETRQIPIEIYAHVTAFELDALFGDIPADKAQEAIDETNELIGEKIIRLADIFAKVALEVFEKDDLRKLVKDEERTLSNFMCYFQSQAFYLSAFFRPPKDEKDIEPPDPKLIF